MNTPIRRLISPSMAVLFLWIAVARAQEPLGEPGVETNPAVLAALELPRTEPPHYLTAVLALVDLQRPELAVPILAELQNLNLSDDQRADLVGEFGSHRMLQLARVAALAPAGGEFAESCMAAASGRARDPQRIEQLIQQLTDRSPLVRHAARTDLAAAGRPGVVALLEAFARETDPERRKLLMAAVLQMDPEAAGPLLGMLATSDPRLKVDVIRLLEAMRVTQALPLIAASSASAKRAERLLVDAIRRYQRGTQPFAPDEQNQVVLWYWDDKDNKLSTTIHAADEAQKIWLARLAIKLVDARPDVRAHQRQALVAGLEVTGDRGSPAIAKLLATSDTAMLSAVLTDAMKRVYSRAAAAAAELLGEHLDVSVLYTNGPQPAPLAEALAYPDRRVRFAALGAIMALDPRTPFPGASRVPETLGYFATSASQRRAVVAMPVARHATTLAGRLANLGIEADAAVRGGPAVRMARQSADLEILLVDVDIQSPGIRDVLFALRSDAATGQIPIGLLATGRRLETARRLATEHRRVVAFSRPQTDDAVAHIAETLNRMSGRDRLSPAERAEMAGQALTWLGQLLARDATFYDLQHEAPVIEAALYLPELFEQSIAALALVGTPSSQRALADFASRVTLPMEARQRAAEAFRASVEQHGILLTEAEILRQYDRYNASATADAATQQVLGSLLDTIESLRAAADALRP